jgi:hypothetical protein
MPLITSWPKDGYYTANKRSTDHGPRDIGPVVPNRLLPTVVPVYSYGPKTLWLLLTPSQGYAYLRRNAFTQGCRNSELL